MILVSSCLAGLEVRYDGKHCLRDIIKRLVDENRTITACPELLGGLPIPRIPAEIIQGDGFDVLDGRAKVVDRLGKDVTDMYIKGAYETLKLVQKMKITTVVLKENSPSCGSSMIYNGEFSGKKVPGNGVTSALLKRNGIKVISDVELTELEELEEML